MTRHTIPGDHQNMVFPPNVDALAETVRVCLERNRESDEPVAALT